MSFTQQKSDAASQQCINFKAMLSEQETHGQAHPLFQKQDFLGLLIKFASLQDHQTHLTGLACNALNQDDPCKGLILVLRTEKTGEISWGCNTCSESGELLNWEESAYNLSVEKPSFVTDPQEELYRIRIGLEEYQVLINPENLYFDLSTERVLFRAKLMLGQIEIAATEVEMENMFALIASSLKHENSEMKREILTHVYRLIQTELDRDINPANLDS